LHRDRSATTAQSISITVQLMRNRCTIALYHCAIAAQSFCHHFAIALRHCSKIATQSHRNCIAIAALVLRDRFVSPRNRCAIALYHCAIAAQSLRNRCVIAAQSLRKRSAITAQSLRAKSLRNCIAIASRSLRNHRTTDFYRRGIAVQSLCITAQSLRNRCAIAA
jgi:hypothetical protein